MSATYIFQRGKFSHLWTVMSNEVVTASELNFAGNEKLGWISIKFVEIQELLVLFCLKKMQRI
jgi:hypothetical protein